MHISFCPRHFSKPFDRLLLIWQHCTDHFKLWNVEGKVNFERNELYVRGAIDVKDNADIPKEKVFISATPPCRVVMIWPKKLSLRPSLKQWFRWAASAILYIWGFPPPPLPSVAPVPPLPSIIDVSCNWYEHWQNSHSWTAFPSRWA